MRDIRFHPAQVLAVSFLIAILVGTVLLSLPFSTRTGPISAVDALFTATSAVCVTGLVVKDTPVDFSPAGQAILLTLLQLGGLGIMTFSTLILLVAGRKIAIRERLHLQSSFHPGIPQDFRTLIRSLFTFTIVIELAGAAVLFPFFLPDHGASRSASIAVFHSISAFCNAGFSLFSDSLVYFRDHIAVNVVIILLIILGGLGFPVLLEINKILKGIASGRKERLSLHSRLVLIFSGALILISAAAFFITEQGAALASFSLRGKILSSLFLGVTARTAGFNTIEVGSVSAASAVLLMSLMFIGASPASTGGGIKTSTIGVVAAFLRSRIRARDSVGLFRRTIPPDLVVKAFSLIAMALALIFVASFLLLASQPGLTIRDALFEVFSAFGTVGLSMGITPHLTTAGKVVIIFMMYIGRVGPLTLLLAFSQQRARGHYEYAEEPVLIG